MTKEELAIALKEQQSIINENQCLASEFNKAVREAKKKQKELKSAFRKQKLVNRTPKPKRLKTGSCPASQMSIVNLKPFVYKTVKCGRSIYENGFCGFHNPDKTRAKTELSIDTKDLELETEHNWLDDDEILEIEDSWIDEEEIPDC